MKAFISGVEFVQMEDVPPFQTHPTVLKMLKLVPPVSKEKRKAMSKMIDTRNLPSRRGHKRPKVNTSIPVKTPVVELDPSASLVAKTPLKFPTFEAPSSCLDLESATVPLVKDPAIDGNMYVRSRKLTDLLHLLLITCAM